VDNEDGRGSSRIKPKKIGVNPPHPRHPRSINPYAGVKDALNRTTQDRYRYRARKQAADSSVSRLLTRAVAVPVSQCCLAWF